MISTNQSTESRWISTNERSPLSLRDGCAPDPCEAPYSYRNYQCLYFTAAKQSFLAAREFCEQFGGFVPYTYTSGYTGGRENHSRPEIQRHGDRVEQSN